MKWAHGIPASLILMLVTTYTNLLNEALALYHQKKFWEAYLLVTENFDHVPRNEAQLDDFRCSLACRAGKPDLAFSILNDAVLKKGFWFSQQYLRTDEDIAPVRSFPGFSPLLEISSAREVEEKGRARSRTKVVRSEDAAARTRPVTLFLHGNMQNISIAEENWVNQVTKGYDLVFIQSSQVEFFDAYSWNDLARGAEDLRNEYDRLVASGEIAGREVILAGFSAGARLALYAAMNSIVPSNGLILVGPWLPQIDEWLPNVPSLSGKGVYILCGDRDDDCLPGAKKLAGALDAAGVNNRIRIVEGMMHDYPDDFERTLPGAIEVATSGN